MSISSDGAAVLRDWREAASHLRHVVPGTGEADRLHAEVVRLREEYHRLSDEAVGGQEPALPAFPSEADPQ